MGIDLSKQLFARHAAGLTASELTVIGYMCVVALDKPNGKGQTAGLYFAGWEPLAISLGYDGLTEPAKTKIKRALRGLREKGLIRPTVEHAQTGTRQSYRIQVGPTGGPDETPNRGSEIDPQEGVVIRPKRGSESDPPRTHTGEGEDLSQDIQLIQESQLQTAHRDEPTRKHKFQGRQGDDCAECGQGYQNRSVHPLRLLFKDPA